MGRGWKDIRKRFFGFLWPSQTINVLLDHFWKTSPPSAAELRAELLCSIPGALKQLIQVVASNNREGKGCSRDQSCSRVLCASIPVSLCLYPCMSRPRWVAPVGSGHMDSEVAVGVSLCTQLDITHLLQVLSFLSFSFTHFGTSEAQSRMKPRAVFVLGGCPSWNLLLADTASSYIDTVISFGILHCIYIF